MKVLKNHVILLVMTGLVCEGISSSNLACALSVNGSLLTIAVFSIMERSGCGCHFSYDADNIFSGKLVGNQWSGENIVQGFRFNGRFSGTPATSFRSGTT